MENVVPKPFFLEDKINLTTLTRVTVTEGVPLITPRKNGEMVSILVSYPNQVNAGFACDAIFPTNAGSRSILFVLPPLPTHHELAVPTT
jgi:hypothetical protein